MKKNEKFGFMSQAYEAPRAESIEMCNDSQLLNASIKAETEGTEKFEHIGGTWDESSGGGSKNDFDPEYIP